MAAPSRFLCCGAVAAAVMAAACGGGTSTAPAIGDPCVVGRWVMTASNVVDTSTPGVTVTYSGGEGFLVTLTAAGTEIDDYSNAAPASSKSSDGHTSSFITRGTEQFKFHASAGHWVESEASGQLTSTNYVVDGIPKPDFTSSAQVGSGTYSCSSSALTMVQTQSGLVATNIFKKA